MKLADIKKHSAKLKTKIDPDVAVGLVRLYERLESGESLAAIFGDDEDRLEGMLPLSLSPFRSEIEDDPKSVVRAVALYRKVAEDGEGCLVPASLVPIARNADHHYLLAAITGKRKGGVYYHDTEGQAGILYDDWEGLELVGKLTVRSS